MFTSRGTTSMRYPYLTVVSYLTRRTVGFITQSVLAGDSTATTGIVQTITMVLLHSTTVAVRFIDQESKYVFATLSEVVETQEV